MHAALGRGVSYSFAGRQRPDGNDETALEGTEDDSSYPAGFWHPYGRGNDALPPSRVVCFSSEAMAQVTLQFPSVDTVLSAQVSHPGKVRRLVSARTRMVPDFRCILVYPAL